MLPAVNIFGIYLTSRKTCSLDRSAFSSLLGVLLPCRTQSTATCKVAPRRFLQIGSMLCIQSAYLLLHGWMTADQLITSTVCMLS